MDSFLVGVQASDLAMALRFSRWGYALVNTAHVLGIALLVGAILPLDLRLMGAWRDVPRDPLVRVLVPVAAVGLALAVVAGLLLFSVRAADYAALPVFRIKVLLVAAGAGSAIALHLAFGLKLNGAGSRHLKAAGAISLTCWLGALIAGRMVAFAGD